MLGVEYLCPLCEIYPEKWNSSKLFRHGGTRLVKYLCTIRIWLTSSAVIIFYLDDILSNSFLRKSLTLLFPCGKKRTRYRLKVFSLEDILVWKVHSKGMYYCKLVYLVSIPNLILSNPRGAWPVCIFQKGSGNKGDAPTPQSCFLHLQYGCTVCVPSLCVEITVAWQK